jgi:hypothetical protein
LNMLIRRLTQIDLFLLPASTLLAATRLELCFLCTFTVD